jgi:hypothetical protein
MTIKRLKEFLKEQIAQERKMSDSGTDFSRSRIQTLEFVLSMIEK